LCLYFTQEIGTVFPLLKELCDINTKGKKLIFRFLRARTKLEKLDPTTMESFAKEILEMINKDKNKSDALHDLELLEYARATV